MKHAPILFIAGAVPAAVIYHYLVPFTSSPGVALAALTCGLFGVTLASIVKP